MFNDNDVPRNPIPWYTRLDAAREMLEQNEEEQEPERVSAMEDLSLYLSVRLAPGSSQNERWLLALDIRHAALFVLQNALTYFEGDAETTAILTVARDAAYKEWKEYAS